MAEDIKTVMQVVLEAKDEFSDLFAELLKKAKNVQTDLDGISVPDLGISLSKNLNETAGTVGAEVKNIQGKLDTLSAPIVGNEINSELMGAFQELIAQVATVKDSIINLGESSKVSMDQIKGEIIDLSNDMSLVGDVTNASLEQISRSSEKVSESLGEVNKKGGHSFKDVSEGADNASERLEKLVEIMPLLIERAMTLGKAFLAWEIFKTVKEWADVAARTEVLGTVLHVVALNAGISQEKIDDTAESIEKLGITTQATRESLTKFLQAGLNIKYATELAKGARDLAVITGADTSSTYERLINNIQILQVRGLRWMGIMVDMTEAEAKYRDANKEVTGALDQRQRQEALTMAVLERTRALQGTYVESMFDVGKQVTSLKRYQEELADSMGKFFLPAYLAIVEEFTNFLKAARLVSDEMGRQSSAAKVLGDNVRSTAKGFGDLILVLIEHKNIVIGLVEGWLLLKGVVLAFSAFTGALSFFASLPALFAMISHQIAIAGAYLVSLLNPIVLFIAAVGLLTMIFVKLDKVMTDGNSTLYWMATVGIAKLVEWWNKAGLAIEETILSMAKFFKNDAMIVEATNKIKEYKKAIAEAQNQAENAKLDVKATFNKESPDDQKSNLKNEEEYQKAVIKSIELNKEEKEAKEELRKARETGTIEERNQAMENLDRIHKEQAEQLEIINIQSKIYKGRQEELKNEGEQIATIQDTIKTWKQLEEQYRKVQETLKNSPKEIQILDGEQISSQVAGTIDAIKVQLRHFTEMAIEEKHKAIIAFNQEKFKEGDADAKAAMEDEAKKFKEEVKEVSGDWGKLSLPDIYAKDKQTIVNIYDAIKNTPKKELNDFNSILQMTEDLLAKVPQMGESFKQLKLNLNLEQEAMGLKNMGEATKGFTTYLQKAYGVMNDWRQLNLSSSEIVDKYNKRILETGQAANVAAKGYLPLQVAFEGTYKTLVSVGSTTAKTMVTQVQEITHAYNSFASTVIESSQQAANAIKNTYDLATATYEDKNSQLKSTRDLQLKLAEETIVDEKSKIATRKAINDKYTDDMKKNAMDYRTAIAKALDEAGKLWDDYVKKAKDLTKQLRDDQISQYDQLNELKKTGMTPEQIDAENKKELLAADFEMRKAYESKNYDEAKMWAQRKVSMLIDAAKEDGQITDEETRKVKEAMAQVNTVTKTQQDENKEAASIQAKLYNSLQDALTDLGNKLKTMTMEQMVNIGISVTNTSIYDVVSKIQDVLNGTLFKINVGLEHVTGATGLSAGKSVPEMAGMAGGGLILGPGTGTSDEIPIWASAREFMMNARSVSHYGEGFMYAINNMMLPKTSLRFASGGSIGGPSGNGISDNGIVTLNLMTDVGQFKAFTHRQEMDKISKAVSKGKRGTLS